MIKKNLFVTKYLIPNTISIPSLLHWKVRSVCSTGVVNSQYGNKTLDPSFMFSSVLEHLAGSGGAGSG